MFFPEARVRVFVYGRPVGMRKSFTGLSALAKQGLGQDPLSGHLLVFINRRGNYIRRCIGIVPASVCGPSSWSAGVS
ncbi:IS66 family insertion sequence element accessory protein TnpB [uncultured Thiodictyon sp.]|uniref:IS66 family insertion sequence element accessory protein TnpB n=1 Tax=uncultured Thiodictyon sp. TaxID=1846217 RepID=UPI003427DA74